MKSIITINGKKYRVLAETKEGRIFVKVFEQGNKLPLFGTSFSETTKEKEILEWVKNSANKKQLSELLESERAFDVANLIVNSFNDRKLNGLANDFLIKQKQYEVLTGDNTNPFNKDVAAFEQVENDFLLSVKELTIFSI